MMKIYYSFYFQDYIFVIGGQAYTFHASSERSMCMVEINVHHLKNSRMHKREEDKEVIFICTVKD